MSIESAAKDLATELVRHEQVEIICHHDADGIAAGAIMSIALYRARIPFRLRTVSRLQAETLPSGRETLLCDLGSGIADLPEETMVIDHHLPVFSGPNHVNPRLSGIDGDTSLSGAGAAYLVANAIGDNRDLAGLVLTGIIGDGQQLIGKNHEIFLEGIGNGADTEGRFYPFFGTPSESFQFSSNYIQLGGLQEMNMGKIRPFGTLAMGLTIWDPKTNVLNTKTQFSATVGGGVKIWLTDFLGIRLQGSMLMPMVFNGFGFGCGIGTGGSSCGTNLYTRVTPFQGEFSGGIIIKISPN